MNTETAGIRLKQQHSIAGESTHRSQKIERSSEKPVSTKSASYEVLLLSTSLLVDRVFRYTGLVDGLLQKAEVGIWNSSYDRARKSGYPSRRGVAVQPFPKVRAFRELRHNFLRRLNEYVWDYRHRPPSRISMMKHRRDGQADFFIRALKPAARILALLRRERVLEKYLEQWLLAYPRSPEATARLKSKRPDVIISTGPFQFEQPAVFSSARSLDIPVMAYIPSWDNISTKNRMVFNYDAYIVWSEQAKKELHEFYPRTKDAPVYVVGAPQFDALRQERFHKTREEFCLDQGLNPNLPLIVYAIGSPNFLKEHHGALHLARRIAEGELGDVQMLVRPHPIHDNAEMKALFAPYEQTTKLQITPNAGREVNARSQDEKQMIEWINTFKHADVVVNLSSTVTIDAAIFDTPVVNLDFDPQPGKADQRLIKEINHDWTHFKPVAECGGVYLVDDRDEMVEAVKTYLVHPELHRDERRWMVEYVCGHVDGKCGQRMADAILDFAAMKRA